MVTQKGNGAGARDPKDFWETTFERRYEEERERRSERKSEREREREAQKSRERGREEEEAEEAAPPQKIEGLGDEAFWTGGRVGGALYVLKGNAFIRVTVGGSGNEQTKINKSKAIAGAALKRL